MNLTLDFLAGMIARKIHRARDAVRRREKYRTDPEFRARKLAREHEKYRTDPEFRALMAAQAREMWADPEYRALMAARQRERWATNPEYRARKAALKRKRQLRQWKNQGQQTLYELTVKIKQNRTQLINHNPHGG